MSLTVMMMALGMSTQPADTVSGPRARFDACLDQRVAAAKAAGKTPDAFRQEVRTACAPEAAAFKKALIDYDRSTGQSPAEAAAWAEDDVNDHRDAAARRYAR